MPLPLLLIVLLATCHGAVAQIPAVARRALDGRGGAAIVLSLPERKVVARQGSEAALEEPHATGSAIKPLTALLALEAGAIRPDTAILCRRHVRSGAKTLTCSHTAVLLPMAVTEALTVSCNYFFAEAGRRLGAAALERGFRQAGFEARVTDPAMDGAGHGSVRATVRQMAEFQAALATGRLPFRAEHQALVRRGLEAAVREGTASPAAVEGVVVAGKTGTAARTDVPYRNSGWFAGWAPAADPRIVVALWLHRGEGRDAAAIAGQILSAFLAQPAALRVELFSSVPLDRVTVRRGNAPPEVFEARSAAPVKRVDCGPDGCSVETSNAPPRRVPGVVEVRRTARGLRVVQHVGLESYVAGVLAGEAGTARHPEALKAIAIAARTFALRHRGRHAAEGFDLCSLTHCQVYTIQSPEDAFQAAAAATAGQTLRYRGKLISAYHSGNCGGHTQAAGEVWPEEAAPYLPARPDAYCAREPWSVRIPAAQLEAALRGDRVTDPGGRLLELAITARDTSGRVRQLRIRGSSTRLVNGNYFRFLAGRRLGWDRLKSTLFDVRREGGDFLFEGRGFGHGIGLCQDGAARMAAAGNDYRRILAQYFPGTGLAGGPRHFTVESPAGQEGDAGDVSARLEAAREKLAARGIPVPGAPVRVVLHASTADFIAATGRPGWSAAASDARTLHLQPLRLLRERGTLDATLAHEYVHLALWDATGARIPTWLREGVAMYFAGEQPEPGTAQAGMPVLLNAAIERPRSRQEMRHAYSRALAETRALVRELGEAGLLRLLRQPTAAEVARVNATGRAPL